MQPASSPLPADFAAASHRAADRVAAMRLDVRYFPLVESTMDVAEEAALAGAPEGLVVLADEQSAGRGRRGHAWASPAGAGLYISIVLRPPAEATAASPTLSLLTITTGVAVRAAIGRAAGLVPDLKWPNDLLIGRRKIAGILAEGHDVGTASQAIVVGVGVNVLGAVLPPELAARATSLEAELGRAIDRAALLEELLVEICTHYDRLRRGEADAILHAWRAGSSSARGTRVAWRSGERRITGVTDGIDEAGALLIRCDAGIERIIAGEIDWQW